LLDEPGRPSLSALQNYGSSDIPINHYVFDVIVLEGVDVMREPFERFIL
jgi:ATP-dependent DNA ligase